jgi:threonine dehydratase
MDMTLLTSISEGQPLTVLESYAAGKPVICTNVGCCRELIYGNDDGFGRAGILTHIMNVEEIAAAILSLIEKQKLIAEGAGAVAVAAVMFNKIPVEGKNVVCLVSGGNIDVNILSRVITRGLVTSGRNATLQIALEDKPGQLVDVATIIASCGANVTGVHYGHSDANTAVTSCVLTLEIETRDFAQLEEVRKTLKDQGFNLVG